MNKKDYDSKLTKILSDESKFEKILLKEENVITKLKK
jgi:hypothetical protein